MTRSIHIPANGGIPNHPRFAALVVPGAAPADIDADGGKALVQTNGWSGAWDWGVYDFHHFHPASHEALLCVAGRATLAIGGPEGEEIDVGPGDGLILPAGTGHRCLSASDDFRVVGCYPPGQESPDIIHASADAVDRYGTSIAAVPVPEHDPFTGGAFEGWA
ncbi:cupin domain-containing protein [Pseudoroseicyclus tamaricis]|uniref:Cupin domain-containing protein n=1 Tax=Pseudoroseicyclus tamaricis TaxID=2705421 RepID=A0A6B2JW48_9RHOB|nr:cupin domain-containing protein [Pseudoroseicyclus tamaricis]NDV02508.1 cupin domain-containing protein [Pseudoroseicyclus tamaricis]